MTRISILALIGAVMLFAAAGNAPSFAQTSQSDIEKALAPKPAAPGMGRTRSLAAPQPAAPDPKTQAVITRSLKRAIQVIGTDTGADAGKVEQASKQEREEIAEIVKEKPKIDLAINFDYNSDVVGPQAIKAVTELGRALRSDGLKNATIMLNGHTDAAGSPEYNLGLSHRRAQSVRRYLVVNFGIPEKQILVTGFGKEQLKDPANPLAGVNRRVEVVNMESQVAGK
jgi:outer membrane protein OmpA-like peptidoglycan-associated protein